MNSPAASWPTKRLRFLAAIPQKRETGGIPDETEVSFVPMESISENGQIETSRTKAIGEVRNGYSYFAEGDIVLAKITPCFENGKGAIATDLVNEVGFGTTELHVVRAGPGLDARFLFYVTKSHEFRKLGEAEMYGAGGQKRVPESFVRDFRVHVPELDEQRMIADFLDRETARLDELVERKRQLIELLRENRVAMIWEFVRARSVASHQTRRHPDLPVLGSHELPDHWQVERLKWWVNLLSGYAFDGVFFKRSADGWPVLITPGNFRPDGGLYFEQANRVVYEGEYSGAFELKTSDLVVVMTDLSYRKLILSHAEFVPTGKYLLNQRVARVDIKPSCVTKLNRKYLRLLINTLVREQVLPTTSGATVFHTSAEKILNSTIFIPPRDEQDSMVAAIEREDLRADAASERIAQAIERLQEYRSSLISAAVTGQIDVRTYRPQEAAVLCQ